VCVCVRNIHTYTHTYNACHTYTSYIYIHHRHGPPGPIVHILSPHPRHALPRRQGGGRRRADPREGEGAEHLDEDIGGVAEAAATVDICEETLKRSEP